MTSYGWGVDRALILIASEVNGISNMATRESAPFAGDGPQTFQNFIMLLRQLVAERLIAVDVQRRNEVISTHIPYDSMSIEDLMKVNEGGYQLEQNAEKTEYILTSERSHYVMSVDAKAWGRPDLTAVTDVLNIKANKPFYEIDGKGKARVDGIRLTTRSVLGMMAYLSNAVSVPEDHAGLVDANVATNPALQQYMNIRVSKSLREGMYLAVKYRGHWFYIMDNDLESKRTLGLLTSLIRLTISAGGAQNVPVLTLPVSR